MNRIIEIRFAGYKFKDQGSYVAGEPLGAGAKARMIGAVPGVTMIPVSERISLIINAIRQVNY